MKRPTCLDAELVQVILEIQAMALEIVHQPTVVQGQREVRVRVDGHLEVRARLRVLARAQQPRADVVADARAARSPLRSAAIAGVSANASSRSNSVRSKSHSVASSSSPPNDTPSSRKLSTFSMRSREKRTAWHTPHKAFELSILQRAESVLARARRGGFSLVWA